jgi:hypothetical protein
MFISPLYICVFLCVWCVCVCGGVCTRACVLLCVFLVRENEFATTNFQQQSQLSQSRRKMRGPVFAYCLLLLALLVCCQWCLVLKYQLSREVFQSNVSPSVLPLFFFFLLKRFVCLFSELACSIYLSFFCPILCLECLALSLNFSFFLLFLSVCFAKLCVIVAKLPALHLLHV